MLEEVAQHVLVLETVEEHLLVIAGEAAQGTQALPFACRGDDAGAMRSAIDEVTQQHDGRMGLR